MFSAEYQKFMDIDPSRMVQFLPLGLQLPADHPDRNKYLSLDFRQKRVNSSQIWQKSMLMSPGDILFLYTDGVYDGSDKRERELLQDVMRGVIAGRRRISAIRCWTTR